jgi:hypothetical protein
MQTNSTIIKKSQTACIKKLGKAFEDTTKKIGLNRSTGDQLLQLLGNKAAAAAAAADDDLTAFASEDLRQS